MRRHTAAALLALLLGAVVFSPSLAPAQDSSAQEPTETTRKIVNKVAPVYPDLARKMQIRGTVKVAVVIAPNGKVKMTHVMGGNPVLAQSAVDAIERWRWAPAPQESQELIELSFHP
jgi:TonB family protein